MRVVIDLLHSNLVTLAHASPLMRPRGCELPPKKAWWGIVGDRDISCRFLSTWGRCDRESVKQNSKTGVCSPCPGRDAILKIAVFVRWSIFNCGPVLRNVFHGSGTAIGVDPSHPSIPPQHQAEIRGSGIVFNKNLHVLTTS